MSDGQQKKRIGNVQTVSGKFGPFKKVSLDLGAMGQVLEKDGKHYLALDDVEGFNIWEDKKNGGTRYFLNLVMNSYETVAADTFTPNSDGNSGGNQANSSGGGDDLPF